MPAYKQSSNIYTETAFGLYTDLPYNPTFDFDWYSECGSEPHIDPSDSTLNASGEASTSPSLFQSIPSASPVSSLSSPERTDSDSESGDNASSSDSDSDAEGDLDQGNWTVVDNHAYLSHTFKDLPTTSLDNSPYVPTPTYRPLASGTSGPLYSSPVPPTADLLYNSPISRSPSLLYPSPSLATTPLSAVPELGLATFQDPPPRASREKANETISYLFAQDSEVDAEGESDDGGSEDEYVPSPRPALRDRAVYNYAYCSRSPSNSSSTSSGYSPRPSPSTRPRPTAPIPRDNRLKRTRPRHAQLATPLDPEKMRNFTCEVCGYVQGNQRKPDFKRHLQTHTRSLEKDKWVCCGVPEEYTGTSNIIKPIMYEGRMMVGGCFKVFSRRDALKRHLDNKNTSCIGALAGYWMSESR